MSKNHHAWGISWRPMVDLALAEGLPIVWLQILATKDNFGKDKVCYTLKEIDIEYAKRALMVAAVVEPPWMLDYPKR